MSFSSKYLKISKRSTKLNTHNKHPLLKSILGAAIVLAINTNLQADTQSILGQQLTQTISQQSLAKSLADVAEQAGIVLLLPVDEYQQLVPALKDSITVKEALDTLLLSNGYRYDLDDSGQLIISVAPSASNSDGLINIYGTQLSRYEFDEGSSATGFDVDVDELPRSVQILPEQLSQDQGADSINDLLVNAAGVTRHSAFGGTVDRIFIRGLDSRIFIDGSPVSNRHVTDVANLESAEVILGPASVLNGRVDPGGLVNLITKKPQEVQANSLQFEIDSEGKRKGVLDTTGPVSDELAYRLVLSREDSELFREVETTEGTTASESDNYTIAPSFRYTPDDYNTFNFSLSYSEQDFTLDRGTVAIEDANGDFSLADIPIERRLNSEFEGQKNETLNLAFEWDKEFENGWKNNFKVNYNKLNFEGYQGQPLSGLNSTPVDFDNELAIFSSGLNFDGVQSNGLLSRLYFGSLDGEDSNLLISDSLTGEYKVGDIDNTLFVSANLSRREISSGDGTALTDTPAALIAAGFGSFVADIDVIDIFADEQAASERRDLTELSRSTDTLDEFGLSIQNLAEINDKLNILTGIRYDRFESSQETTNFYETLNGGTSGFNQLATPSESDTSSENDNVSIQLGALYDVNDNFSFYASYSEGFTPNFPTVRFGQSSVDVNLAPEESSQFEVGIKSNFFNDKLRLNVAAYDITRENVLSFDNNGTASVNGEERSRGLDISSTMQFTPGLNVIASVSFLDTEIVEDDTATNANKGNQLSSIPEKKARIWGSYEVQGGKYKGLGFGLGVEYVGDRYGNDENTFELPSYTVADTAIWYYLPVGKDKSLRFQAGIKNITDEEYFTASGGNIFRVNVGSPRTAYLNLRYDF